MATANIVALHNVMIAGKRLVRGDVYLTVEGDATHIEHLTNHLKWTAFKILPVGQALPPIPVKKKSPVAPAVEQVNPAETVEPAADDAADASSEDDAGDTEQAALDAEAGALPAADKTADEPAKADAKPKGKPKGGKK